MHKQETSGLNVDASKAAPTATQPKPVRTYISKPKQTLTTPVPPPVAQQIVPMKKPAEPAKHAAKSPMAPQAPQPPASTPPPAAAVSKTQTVSTPQIKVEIAPSVDKGKKAVDQPKGEFPDPASFLQTPVHIRHEVVSSGGTKNVELLIHVTLTPLSHPPHYSDLEMEMMGSAIGASPSVGHSSSAAFDPIIEMGVLALSGMPDAEAKPILFCSCNDASVRLYELPSFTERGRLFGKREVRAIQIGPGGLFFSGDATSLLSVWKWLDPGLKELSS